MISSLLLAKQLVSGKIMDAASGPAYWAIGWTLFVVLWTLASLLQPKGSMTYICSIRDSNFRITVLAKASLLVAKTILVAIPEQADVVDVTYIWSCVQRHCPSWCTGLSGGGYCVPLHGVCSCQSLRPDNLVWIANILSSFTIGVLTLVDFFSTIRSRRRDTEFTSRFIFGTCLCNVAHIICLILAVVLPISAFSSRPGLAGIFALPLVPHSLLINELKWILHVLKERRGDVPIVQERGGLKIILCTYSALSILAAGILSNETVNMTRQPSYTQAYDGKYIYVAFIGIATLIGGAVASLLTL